MSDKLCANCKFSEPPPEGGYLYRCRAPQNKIYSRSSERLASTLPYEPTWHYTLCGIHREDGILSMFFRGTCGRVGRWFQPKENNS